MLYLSYNFNPTSNSDFVISTMKHYAGVFLTRKEKICIRILILSGYVRKYYGLRAYKQQKFLTAVNWKSMISMPDGLDSVGSYPLSLFFLALTLKLPKGHSSNTNIIIRGQGIFWEGTIGPLTISKHKLAGQLNLKKFFR